MEMLETGGQRAKTQPPRRFGAWMDPGEMGFQIAQRADLGLKQHQPTCLKSFCPSLFSFGDGLSGEEWDRYGVDKRSNATGPAVLQVPQVTEGERVPVCVRDLPP